MYEKSQIDQVVAQCRQNLDWSGSYAKGEYFAYRSLPVTIIHAVFSINASFEKIVVRVMDRYRAYVLQETGKDPTVEEQSVSAFLEIADRLGAEEMAKSVYQNRQRTSAASGILKSEAAMKFARIVQQFGVETNADVGKIIDSDRFCRRIRMIPGQCLSMDYFLMMIGRDDLIKADRMVQRFVSRSLNGAAVTQSQALWLLTEVTKSLQSEYPKLSPRLLDAMIWEREARYSGTVPFTM